MRAGEGWDPIKGLEQTRGREDTVRSRETEKLPNLATPRSRANAANPPTNKVEESKVEMAGWGQIGGAPAGEREEGGGRGGDPNDFLTDPIFHPGKIRRLLPDPGWSPGKIPGPFSRTLHLAGAAPSG